MTWNNADPVFTPENRVGRRSLIRVHAHRARAGNRFFQKSLSHRHFLQSYVRQATKNLYGLIKA